MSIVFKSWGKSDVGLIRENNEDSFVANDECYVFAVADGMGGHKGGAMASKLAIETFLEVVCADPDTEEDGMAFVGNNDLEKTRGIDTPTKLSIDHSSQNPLKSERAAQEASKRVFQCSIENAEFKGMGTTLTALFYDHDNQNMQLVHVGDSRAYRLRDSALERLTQDHSWVSEQMTSGKMSEEEAKASEFRHVITRSIGHEKFVNIDTMVLDVCVGDVYLLCSDGLINDIEDGELEQLLLNTKNTQVANVLIDLAKSRGGEDNITVVLAEVLSN